MGKFYPLPIFFVLLFASPQIVAQQPVEKNDTFFLAKKKGLLGRLGRSISTDPPVDEPIQLQNPYLRFKKKIIRNIEFVSLGFERNINDTTLIKRNFGVRVANTLHHNTREKVIRHNLFFAKGDRLFPYLIADNERHLRQLPYLQDARIIADDIFSGADSVDIIVITKDVFSLGGSVTISNTKSGRMVLKEENFNGSATRIALNGFYDKDRGPSTGYGGEMVNRNVAGSFADFTIGFKNFGPAFNNGRRQESVFYTGFDKPLVSAYIPWTGAVNFSFNKTFNNYYAGDSVYKTDFRYEYFNADAWAGYNFGSRKYLYTNKETRLRKFIALRVYSRRFNKIPAKAALQYDYNYADNTGVLASVNIFKQEFYRTNFIYGFGRNEDVPEGYSLSFTGGWTNQQGKHRPYYGLDFRREHFIKKGIYSSYFLSLGGYYESGKFADANVLANLTHFTRLKKMKGNWLNRNFINAGFTKLINPVLSAPLFLQSDFGLPYFNNATTAADFRSTLKLESVFFNTNKILGFRLAPFVFTDVCMVTPINKTFAKSDVFTAVGSGIRSRNENLLFGTMELKGYFFPRVIPGMKNYRVEFSTKLLFKYNSTFIRKPDFVVAN